MPMLQMQTLATTALSQNLHAHLVIRAGQVGIPVLMPVVAAHVYDFLFMAVATNVLLEKAV
jgi:hypothetical protein